MRPDHVLFVIESLGRGGAEESTKRIVANLTAQGVRCTVAHLFPPSSLADELEHAGSSVVWLGIRTWRQLPVAVMRLARLERRLAPQVVHSHLYFASVSTALTSLLPSAPPRFVTLHSVDYSDPTSPWRRATRKALHRLALKRHRRLIAVTEDVAEHYVRELGCSVKPAVIANPVVDRPPRDGSGTPGLIVCPARLTAEKRHDRLLDAFALVYERDPHARLTLAGEGPLRSAVERQVRDLRLGDAVELLGEIDQESVLELINAANVVALASDYEGFGMGVADAMALGVPVVITRVPGLRTLVRDRETGMSVSREDVNGIAEALHALITCSDLASRLGKAGREDIRIRFSSDTVVEGLLDLYASALLVSPQVH